ncbi:MAG: cupin domain-containing protein, partial [Solimonas sp.]
MMTRRVLMGSAAGLLLANELIAAQAAANAPKVVFEHDVPDLTMKGWSAAGVEVSYAPGQSSAPHRHPGITIVYVLEGEIVSKVGDAPERTYKAGEMFLETPNQLHGVSRNASTTRPAKLLAVMLSEKGK